MIASNVFKQVSRPSYICVSKKTSYLQWNRPLSRHVLNSLLISCHFSAGQVEIPEWSNSLSNIGITWTGFKSNLTMMFYHVGIGEMPPEPTFDCEEMVLYSYLYYIT